MLGLVFKLLNRMVLACDAKAETLTVAGKLNCSLNCLASSQDISRYFLAFFPPFPILIIIPLFRIVKVLAPMLVKLLLMLPFMESIAVRMPIRAVIPNAIIITVRMVRNHCPRILCRARKMLSRRVNLVVSREY